jgi:hypothetical protein
MINLIKIISTEFDDLKRRIPKFLRFGKNDVQTAIESAPYGIDSNPIKDMIAVYAETGEKGKPVIIGYLNKNQKAEVGELRLYATDASGSEKFYIWLKKDGIVEVGGDTNFAVKYTELKQELDKLKQDHNTLVNIFNTHIHTVAANPSGLVATPTSTTAMQNQSDFSKAKNDKIKTIG